MAIGASEAERLERVVCSDQTPSRKNSMRYWVTGAPPSSAGACQLRLTLPSKATLAEKDWGAELTCAGVVTLRTWLAADSPMELMAINLKSWLCPRAGSATVNSDDVPVCTPTQALSTSCSSR